MSFATETLILHPLLCNKAILVQINMLFAIFVRGPFVAFVKIMKNFGFLTNCLGYGDFAKVHDFPNTLIAHRGIVVSNS